jgi:hypothetical protein
MHVIVFAIDLNKRRREVPHTAANSPRMSFSTLAVKTLRRYLVTKTKRACSAKTQCLQRR